MLATYQKDNYFSKHGYYVTHTAGFSAEDSTLDYPHTTAHFILFYLKHGSGTIKINGRRYDFCAGDMVLLDPTALFHCEVEGNVFHERIVLHWKPIALQGLPCNAAALAAPFQGEQNRIAAEVVSHNGLDVLMEQILFWAKQPAEDGAVMMLCKITELLVKLKRLGPLGADSAAQSSDPLIDRVLLYLNEAFAQELSVDDVAKRFFVDRSYLSHRFKEHVGLSLWTYVTLRRLHRFNELVRQGMSIEEAHFKVGFQNYSNFFRLYKKYMGTTPKHYQLSLKNGHTAGDAAEIY